MKNIVGKISVISIISLFAKNIHGQNLKVRIGFSIDIISDKEEYIGDTLAIAGTSIIDWLNGYDNIDKVYVEPSYFMRNSNIKFKRLIRNRLKKSFLQEKPYNLSGINDGPLTNGIILLKDGRYLEFGMTLATIRANGLVWT